MQNELEEAIGALRTLYEGATEGHGKPLSRERLLEIQDELKVLEAQHMKQRAEEEEIRKHKLRQDAIEEAKSKSYSDKMHELSFKNPDVWRALKQQQLDAQEREEGDNAGRRQKELQDALSSAVTRPTL